MSSTQHRMERFRPATAPDADAIIELMRRYYAADGYAFVEDEARSAALDLMRDARLGRLWVAQDDGRVVGYLAVTLGFSLEYRGRDAFIDEFFVAEGSRGQSFGREGLEIAETYGRGKDPASGGRASSGRCARALPARRVRESRPRSHDEMAR